MSVKKHLTVMCRKLLQNNLTIFLLKSKKISKYGILKIKVSNFFAKSEKREIKSEKIKKRKEKNNSQKLY